MAINILQTKIIIHEINEKSLPGAQQWQLPQGGCYRFNAEIYKKTNVKKLIATHRYWQKEFFLSCILNTNLRSKTYQHVKFSRKIGLKPPKKNVLANFEKL